MVDFEFKEKALSGSSTAQGCQMAHLQTENPTLGKFLRILRWEMNVGLCCGLSVYFAASLYLFLCHFSMSVYIWYFLPVLVVFAMKNLATLLRQSFVYDCMAYRAFQPPFFSLFMTHSLPCR
jgi:hypothetical protein